MSFIWFPEMETNFFARSYRLAGLVEKTAKDVNKSYQTGVDPVCNPHERFSHAKDNRNPHPTTQFHPFLA